MIQIALMVTLIFFLSTTLAGLMVIARNSRAAQRANQEYMEQMFRLARMVKYKNPKDLAIAESSDSPLVFTDEHRGDEDEHEINLTKAEAKFLQDLGIQADPYTVGFQPPKAE